MPGSRRLSQRISEGDGIAIIARVGDVESARAAEAAGAKALAVDGAVAGIREATSLPVLWLGDGVACRRRCRRDAAGATTSPTELEAVLDVRDEDELEEALEQHDPRDLPARARVRATTTRIRSSSVLELLPDVPAGKLAIADVDVATRDEVVALERAGFDAVLAIGAVGDLVGVAPPDV